MIPASGHVPERPQSAAPRSFEALAGQLQRALMSGDTQAFARVQEQRMEAIAKVGEPEESARWSRRCLRWRRGDDSTPPEKG